jgi:hypothetical protein
MALKTLNGWIFCVPLTVRRVFTYPGNLPRVDGLQGYPLQKSQKLKGIEQFVDARRLSGYPITISLEGDPLGDLDQTRGGVGVFPPAASHGCVFMHVPHRHTSLDSDNDSPYSHSDNLKLRDDRPADADSEHIKY